MPPREFYKQYVPRSTAYRNRRALKRTPMMINKISPQRRPLPTRPFENKINEREVIFDS